MNTIGRQYLKTSIILSLTFNTKYIHTSRQITAQWRHMFPHSKKNTRTSHPRNSNVRLNSSNPTEQILMKFDTWASSFVQRLKANKDNVTTIDRVTLEKTWGRSSGQHVMICSTKPPIVYQHSQFMHVKTFSGKFYRRANPWDSAFQAGFQSWIRQCRPLTNLHQHTKKLPQLSGDQEEMHRLVLWINYQFSFFRSVNGENHTTSHHQWMLEI